MNYDFLKSIKFIQTKKLKTHESNLWTIDFYDNFFEILDKFLNKRFGNDLENLSTNISLVGISSNFELQNYKPLNLSEIHLTFDTPF